MFYQVSVAIDATPAARTISVLKQTPIELTKSMDAMGHVERVGIKPSLSLGSISKKTLSRSDALNESDDLLSSQDTLHKSSTSIQLKPATKEKRPGIKVTHGYSKSEPAQDTSKEPLYSQVRIMNIDTYIMQCNTILIRDIILLSNIG